MGVSDQPGKRSQLGWLMAMRRGELRLAERILETKAQTSFHVGMRARLRSLLFLGQAREMFSRSIALALEERPTIDHVAKSSMIFAFGQEHDLCFGGQCSDPETLLRFARQVREFRHQSTDRAARNIDMLRAKSLLSLGRPGMASALLDNLIEQEQDPFALALCHAHAAAAYCALGRDPEPHLALGFASVSDVPHRFYRARALSVLAITAQWVGSAAQVDAAVDDLAQSGCPPETVYSLCLRANRAISRARASGCLAVP